MPSHNILDKHYPTENSNTATYVTYVPFTANI